MRNNDDLGEGADQGSLGAGGGVLSCVVSVGDATGGLASTPAVVELPIASAFTGWDWASANTKLPVRRRTGKPLSAHDPIGTVRWVR